MKILKLCSLFFLFFFFFLCSGWWHILVLSLLRILLNVWKLCFRQIYARTCKSVYRLHQNIMNSWAPMLSLTSLSLSRVMKVRNIVKLNDFIHLTYVFTLHWSEVINIQKNVIKKKTLSKDCYSLLVPIYVYQSF